MGMFSCTSQLSPGLSSGPFWELDHHDCLQNINVTTQFYHSIAVYKPGYPATPGIVFFASFLSRYDISHNVYRQSSTKGGGV